MNQKCRYENCGAEDRLNDEGICSHCATVREKVKTRLETGRLPKMPSGRLDHGIEIRMKPVRGLGLDMPCAACDEAIKEEHCAYPDFAGPGKYDLHFHDVCDEIWQREATVA